MPSQNNAPAPLPLAGLAVLVTRPAHQADGLCHLIEAAGGRAIRWPVLAITGPEDLRTAQGVVDRLGEFEIAVFVSVNAVDWGLKLVRDRHRSLSHLTVVAVGKGTAARLRKERVAHPITPQHRSDTEGMLELPVLQPTTVAGMRVVIFRGSGGRERLAEALRERGARVEYAEVYRRVRTTPNPKTLIERWDQGQIGVVIATSAEGLTGLLEMMGHGDRSRLLDTPVLAMSERTAAFALTLGFTHRPLVTKDASDVGLVEALISWRRSQDHPGPMAPMRASPVASRPNDNENR